MKKKTLHLVLLSTILSACLVAGLLYWRHTQLYPSTDDAYVNAHVINMAAQVSGPVIASHVENDQLVEKDQALFDIDPKPFEIGVEKATAALNLAKQQVAAEQASVKAAEAQVTEQTNVLILAQKNAKRILPLVKTGRIAKTEGDEVTERLDVAQAGLDAAKQNLEKAKQELGLANSNNAQIQSAQATLDQAILDLQHTHIVAPSSGRLINFTTRVGDMINAGSDLFSIIEEKSWWVDANFKETQLKNIRIGQPAVIYVDLYPQYVFQGIVTNISQGSGAAFSLLPAENATGNWVKVTQRFPVKITIVNLDNRYPLGVGASARVIINTRVANTEYKQAANAGQ